MRNWAWGAAALLVLASCQNKAAERQPEKRAPREPEKAAVAITSAIKPGVYGDVAYIEEAGDLVGVELQIPERSDQPIEITLCEGNCYTVVRASYVVKDDAIEFDYRDGLVDQDGKEAGETLIHFRLESRGKDVMLINLPVSDDLPPERLKRLPKRSALDYALEQMKEHARQSRN